MKFEKVRYIEDDAELMARLGREVPDEEPKPKRYEPLEPVPSFLDGLSPEDRRMVEKFAAMGDR